jgi:hypothetical protein
VVLRTTSAYKLGKLLLPEVWVPHLTLVAVYGTCTVVHTPTTYLALPRYAFTLSVVCGLCCAMYMGTTVPTRSYTRVCTHCARCVVARLYCATTRMYLVGMCHAQA